MTRPNDFILNSDYLALAQTNKTEFTAYFAPETFPPGQAYDRTRDYTVPYTPGAIDMYLLSLNDNQYVIGPGLVISATAPNLYLFVSRINSKTLRVRLHEFNSQTGGYSMPTQTLKVKVVSFKPPNVF